MFSTLYYHLHHLGRINVILFMAWIHCFCNFSWTLSISLRAEMFFLLLPTSDTVQLGRMCCCMVTDCSTWSNVWSSGSLHSCWWFALWILNFISVCSSFCVSSFTGLAYFNKNTLWQGWPIAVREMLPLQMKVTKPCLNWFWRPDFTMSIWYLLKRETGLFWSLKVLLN